VTFDDIFDPNDIIINLELLHHDGVYSAVQASQEVCRIRTNRSAQRLLRSHSTSDRPTGTGRGVDGMVEDAMRGDIDLAPFVTHTMGLEEINEDFALMHEGKSIRTVIHY